MHIYIYIIVGCIYSIYTCKFSFCTTPTYSIICFVHLYYILISLRLIIRGAHVGNRLENESVSEIIMVVPQLYYYSTLV